MKIPFKDIIAVLAGVEVVWSLSNLVLEGMGKSGPIQLGYGEWTALAVFGIIVTLYAIWPRWKAWQKARYQKRPEVRFARLYNLLCSHVDVSERAEGIPVQNRSLLFIERGNIVASLNKRGICTPSLDATGKIWIEFLVILASFSAGGDLQEARLFAKEFVENIKPRIPEAND